MPRGNYSALERDVDRARADVRLYQYPIPTEIVGALCPLCGGREQHKLPHLALERNMWTVLPNSSFTDDPEKADFFVVPHTMLSNRLGKGKMLKNMKLFFSQAWSPFLRMIRYGLPYYNRSNGLDHLFVWVGDLGPSCDCYGLDAILSTRPLEREMMQSMIRVGYFGSNDPRVGWRQGVDIGVPMWNAFHLRTPPPPWQALVRETSNRSNMAMRFSYWGTATQCVGQNHSCGCSSGIRHWLRAYKERGCHRSAEEAKQAHQYGMGPRCTNASASHGWYTLCPAGFGCWSARMYDAIDQLSIPVVLANGALQPYERFLDWRSFSIQLDTEVLSGYQPVPQPTKPCINHAPLWDGSCTMPYNRTRQPNATGLDQLHLHAERIAMCRSAPTSESCAALPVVRMVRELERVRRWFAWNGSDPYSAIGLFLLELRCRMSLAQSRERAQLKMLPASCSTVSRSRNHGIVGHHGHGARAAPSV